MSKKFKIMGKNPVIVLAVLLIVAYLASGGQPLQKLQGAFAFNGVIGSYSQGSLLSKADFLNNNCQIATQIGYTISCKRVGSPLPSTVAVSTSGQSFIPNVADPYISSLSPDFNSNVDVVRDDSGSVVCQGTSCLNTRLIIGKRYVARVETGFCLSGCTPSLVYTGYPLLLTLSDSLGRQNIPIPASANCVMQDITNSGVASNILGTIDAAAPRSVGISQENQAEFYANGYTTLATITPTFVTQNGVDYPAVIDLTAKKVYGFTGHTGLTGTCYALPDPSQTFVNGANTQYFCAANTQCQSLYGLSSDYSCVNYACTKGTSTQQCLTSNDCGGQQYITNQDGTTISRYNSCSSGVCTKTDTTIACNPTTSYPNGQVCSKDSSGTWRLVQAQQGLIPCSNLGADACCTAQQSQYTVKDAPLGQFCCQLNSDGLGTVVSNQAACQAKAPSCTIEGGTPNAITPCCRNLVIDAKSQTCIKEGSNNNDLMNIVFWIAILLIVLIIFVAYLALKKKR